jgi:hypothetical protein
MRAPKFINKKLLKHRSNKLVGIKLVGIVSGCGIEGLGFESWQWREIFSSPKPYRPAAVVQAPYFMVVPLGEAAGTLNRQFFCFTFTFTFIPSRRGQEQFLPFYLYLRRDSLLVAGSS